MAPGHVCAEKRPFPMRQEVEDGEKRKNVPMEKITLGEYRCDVCSADMLILVSIGRKFRRAYHLLSDTMMAMGAAPGLSLGSSEKLSQAFRAQCGHFICAQCCNGGNHDIVCRKCDSGRWYEYCYYRNFDDFFFAMLDAQTRNQTSKAKGRARRRLSLFGNLLGKVKVKDSQLSDNEAILLIHFKQLGCSELYRLVRSNAGIALMRRHSNGSETCLGTLRGILEFDILVDCCRSLDFAMVDYGDMLSDVSSVCIVNSLSRA